MEKFKVTYSACDGYVGKSRPIHFNISTGELDEDMTDDDLVELFEQSMQDHFEHNVFPESEDCNAFVSWARQQLNNISEDI